MSELRKRLKRPLYRAAFEKTVEKSAVRIPTELETKVARLYELEVRRFLKDDNVDIGEVNAQIAQQYGFASADELLLTFFEWEDRKLKMQSGEEVPELDPKKRTNFAAIEKAVAAVSGAHMALEQNSERSLLRILDHAIQVVMLEAEAERTQNTDDLTGLIDSQTFVAKRMEVEVQQFLATPETEAGEDEKVMVWAEIDLDDFKTLNTAYSHATVDFQILKPLAALLRETFRETDFICRLGGDELNIIFTRTKKSAVAALGQRIIDVIHTLPLPEPASGQFKPEQLTASVGLHVMDRSMLSKLDLTSPELVMNSIRKPADSATERAKFFGKDRYEVYDPDAEAVIPTFEVYLKLVLRKHEEEFRQMRHRQDYTTLDQFQEHLSAAAQVAYQFKYLAAATA
ncbi:MAG: GGDEF domain-containing protein [Candidatus Kerfeldbacteria bacterium]|nr:GGDEF domain-containing protein [Candidatus Kerfeldbacteria bacterium]